MPAMNSEARKRREEKRQRYVREYDAGHKVADEEFEDGDKDED